MLKMDKLLPPPPGWGTDGRTNFFEAAYRNRFATFANKRNWFERLAALDACFVGLANEWLNPQNPLTPMLFIRCHSAYRATCEHAFAGQVPDTFPQLRACLEYAGYALHIHKNPELGETWLKRNDDKIAKKAVINEFKPWRIRATIKRANRHAALVFDELYERAIDFGAHPNAAAVLGSLEITKFDDRKSYDSSYLHGDGLALDHVLKTTAQAGVCALEIFKEVFPERFELLGISAKLLELRKGV